MPPLFIVVIIVSYLLGAIPFALLIARVAKLPDPRSYGSGNVGATNIARSGNKTAAILTLLADGGKGAVAILAAVALLPPEFSHIAAAAAGFVAVFGHVTSPFLRFRGGRGVATALAVYLCWQPLLGVAVLAVWGAVFAVFRYSSLASLTATVAATVLCYFFLPLQFLPAAVAINIVIFVRHAENIRRLWQRSEQGFEQ